jgi:hypothetical protein
LYARLDHRLRQKTRFFGAAFLTNRVLGYLAPVRRSLSISEPTCHWLAGLGELLEAANLALVSMVETAALEGLSLDAAIVAHEQSIVAQALREAHAVQPALYERMMSELDLLLNTATRPALLRLSTDVNRYCRVLSTVRRQLACPIEFALQRHREIIGMALIQSLREETASGLVDRIRQLKQHVAVAGLP